MFPGVLGHSLTGQALKAGRWSLDVTNIRDFGLGRHAQVDDSPAGGGAGMVMRADVIAAAIDHVMAQPSATGLPIIYLSPRGTPFNQALAHCYADGPGVVLLAGRFEGVDERVLEARNVHEVSIGDFVLTGGELPAMAVLDACLRLLPGVVGSPDSIQSESFEGGLLEYPQYTRPRVFEGREIPEVLLSGDHARIAAWRKAQSENITALRRPDLLPKTNKKSTD